MSAEAEFREFSIDGKPFGGSSALFNVVQVEYKTNFLKHEYDARELRLHPGELVVVEAEKGPVIGTVRSHVHRKVAPKGSLMRVLRVANDHDLLQAQRNEEMEKTAHTFAIQRIRARKLPMKLVRAHWIHDGSKVVFYFSADGRVDFRDLVKDLAHRFRTRIEMHQIGVRDGTRMIGGIGPCGRELCCSTFLEKFAPVSIRMAKDQGMTLNPKKVSGQCGRLMCCLVYEQKLYRKQRKRLPRAGKRVRTALGSGKILDVDVINKRLQIELEDGNRKTFDLDDVVLDAGGGNEAAAPPVAATDYLWDDLSPVTLEDDPGADSESDDKPKRRRRRRSRGSKNRPKDGGEQPKKSSSQKSSSKRSASKRGNKKTGEPKADKPADKDKKSGSSRRRRRRGKKKGKGDKGGSGSNEPKDK